MKRITEIRKSVCTIANHLRKAGLSLSEAFRKAWQRVRRATFKVAGVTANGGQKKLQYLDGISRDDIAVGLRREPENKYDGNAVQVLAMVRSLRIYAVIGYVPRVIAERIAPLMDQGIKIRADFGGIIGGYGEKENYGMLVNVSV